MVMSSSPVCRRHFLLSVSRCCGRMSNALYYGDEVCKYYVLQRSLILRSLLLIVLLICLVS